MTKQSSIPVEESASKTREPELLAEIRAFLNESGMAPTRFGKLTMRDPSFIAGLEQGREVMRRTRQRVTDFMADHRRRLAEESAGVGEGEAA